MRCCAQLRQDVVHSLRHQQIDGKPGADEIQSSHLLYQRAKRIPELLHIENKDWFLMPTELRPGELLDQLFERADATRQGHEGVRALEHDSFALMHVARDDSLLHAY